MMQHPNTIGQVHAKPPMSSGLLNALEAEACFAEGVADGGDVGGTAGFDGYVDDGFAEAHSVIGAVVYGFNDVGALAGEDLRELQQGAGTVLQIDANAQEAAVFYQAAFDDFGEKTYVDVAAADEDYGAAVAEVGFRLDYGGEGGCSGSFGEGLFLFEEQEDGAGDFFVVDGDDLIDVAGDERQGKVAGAPDSDAVGDGGFSGDGDGMAGLAGAEHRGQLLRLDADDADFGIGFLERAASMSGTCSRSSRPMVP